MVKYAIHEQTKIVHYLEVDAPTTEVEEALDEIGEDCSLLELQDKLDERFGEEAVFIRQEALEYRNKISIEEWEGPEK